MKIFVDYKMTNIFKPRSNEIKGYLKKKQIVDIMNFLLQIRVKDL